MNRRFCEMCSVDVHKAGYSRHLPSEKHIKNEVENNSRMIKMMRNPDYWINDTTLSTSDGTKINLDTDRIDQLSSKY